jgi:hypothetical protein
MFFRCCKKGLSYTLASGYRADVEIFDAGEEATCGDVEAVSEDGHADCTVMRPGGEYLQVSGLDGIAQALDESFWDGLAISERLFEERQGFG